MKGCSIGCPQPDMKEYSIGCPQPDMKGCSIGCHCLLIVAVMMIQVGHSAIGCIAVNLKSVDPCSVATVRTTVIHFVMYNLYLCGQLVRLLLEVIMK